MIDYLKDKPHLQPTHHSKGLYLAGVLLVVIFIQALLTNF